MPPEPVDPLIQRILLRDKWCKSQTNNSLPSSLKQHVPDLRRHNPFYNLTSKLAWLGATISCRAKAQPCLSLNCQPTPVSPCPTSLPPPPPPPPLPPPWLPSGVFSNAWLAAHCPFQRQSSENLPGLSWKSGNKWNSAFSFFFSHNGCKVLWKCCYMLSTLNDLLGMPFQSIFMLLSPK